MRFVIETAKPIKAPLVIRFGVVMYDNDENLAGEYEISVDLEPYIDYQVDESRTNVNINAVAVQQHITSAIAEMQIATLIANGFIDLEWTADQEDDEDDEDQTVDGGLSATPFAAESKEDESTEYTGDTIKLRPVLPEGS